MSRHEKWVYIDLYKRKFVLKYLLKKKLLNSIKKTTKSTNSRRYLSYIYEARLPRISSITVINNRCVNSGRIWSTDKKTGLSRFELRKNVYRSNVPGFRRASW